MTATNDDELMKIAEVLVNEHVEFINSKIEKLHKEFENDEISSLLILVHAKLFANIILNLNDPIKSDALLYGFYNDVHSLLLEELKQDLENDSTK